MRKVLAIGKPRPDIDDNITIHVSALSSTEVHQRDIEDRGCFASLAPEVISNGYNVIPIIPETKRVPRSEPDWRRFCWHGMTSEEMKFYRERYADHGLAIACGFHSVAIDIDSEDRRISRELMSAAEDIFSKTPLVRVGKEPHINLVYACAEPILTYMLPFLEILGVGRYLVVYGNHPITGDPYKWVQGRSPVDTPVAGLPQITQNSVDLYIRTVCPILGINYADIAFDIGQEHMERMLSSRTQLLKQLVLAIFKGKPAAKNRARELLGDGIFCVPTFKLRRSARRIGDP